MSRLSVAVLGLQSEDKSFFEAVSAAAARADVSFAGHMETYEDLLTIVEEWTILPEILMIQVPRDANPVDVLQAFGERFPEGEADTILFDVPNDISVYRALKQKGVREIFSGFPSAEDVEAILEEIRISSLRRVGIDPRKAIYVFSCCGGAGGTSLATTFARKFSRDGRRTLYIDLDLATGPGSFMFNAEKGARETMGLMEALANPGRIDALFLERAIDIADKNLFYLSARRRASDPDPDPASIPVLISRAQQNFDMVILDIPWRPNPEPDMMMVQGTCYLVTPPSPAGLLGFSVLAKELDSAPARNPIYGILNRQGEFKSNDIESATFKEAVDVEMMPIPYDAGAAGRMFFEQKTYLDMSGKIRKSIDRILKTLPGQGADAPVQKARNAKEKPKKKGLFGR